MAGFEGVVGVATLQFSEGLFVSPLDWKTIPGDIETSQLRTFFAVVECAQQAGLILAWEQLLSTPLLPVCDHRVAFRLHVIAQCELKKHQFEELIVMACKGDMRDGGKSATSAWESETSDRNSAKRRKQGPSVVEPLPSEACVPDHFRFLRLDDLRRTLGVMTFGSEESEPYQEFSVDTTPRVEEEGSDSTEGHPADHRGGIFECFAIFRILATPDASDEASSTKTRYDTWRVWKDDATGHDPRTWESYVDEDGGDCRWAVDPEYGAKAIRYTNFSETSRAFRWIRGVSDLRQTARPWEEPSIEDIKRCILKHSGSSDLEVPTIDHLSLDDLHGMVKELNMYENGMPVTTTRAIVASNADATVQAQLYPHTDRLRKYFCDFNELVLEGVKSGVLDPAEIALAETTCLTRLRAQFTRNIEGYCPAPHSAMMELSKVLATLNRKMSLEARASEPFELQTLRKMAFNPRGSILALHPESVDVLHTLNMVRDYEGMSASQTRGLTLILSHAGLNYRPDWDAHARYFLFTGFPGGGKSELMIRYRLWMPNESVVGLDMLSQKALFYNGNMLDMKVVTLDEAPGQVKGQEWLVQLINTCSSKGFTDYQTTVWDPRVKSDGSVSSVGGSFKVTAAARTIWLAACNTRIHDEAGAAKDRRTEIDIVKTGDEQAPPAGSKTIVECARLIHKVVTLTIGYGFFAMMYGIIVPSKPVMTIFDVFMEMVVKCVPELSRFHLRHRQRETLKALAIRNWMARKAHDHLFPKRNTEEMAWATEMDKEDRHRYKRIKDRYFAVQTPDIVFLRSLATSTVSAVDCVVALALLQESDTMHRRFIGILIQHLSIHLGDFVRSDNAEDEDYRKTSFNVSGSDLRLPAVLIAMCEKQRIPGFSQHKIVQEGISVPVYSGSPALKIETNAPGNPSLMVHMEAIKKGFRTPSPGQVEILERIWACDAAWDFEEQTTAVISNEQWTHQVRKDDGTVDLRRELLAMQYWELEPGKPCVQWKDDSIGGTGFINIEVAVMVSAEPGQVLPEGYNVAQANGPLQSVDGQPVPIKPKTLSRATVMPGDFYRMIPAITSGKDVCGRDARVFRKQRINRFLLACGVKPGAIVFDGTYDLPTPRGDIADIHTVTTEQFLETIPNPRYVCRQGMYAGGVARADPVFTPDVKNIQISDTSNFGEEVERYVRTEYNSRRRPPEPSQTVPGQNRYAAFFGFDEGI
jgi:hypothetical protein